jgi:hypothetical protein
MVGLTVVFTWRLAKARNAALAVSAPTQRIQRFMIDVFQAGDAIAGPAGDVNVVDMLDRGARAAQALNSDPNVRADLLFNFAEIYHKQGQLEKAESLLLLALDQRQLLHGSDGAEVGGTLTALGMLRADQSRLEEAEPHRLNSQRRPPRIDLTMRQFFSPPIDVSRRPECARYYEQHVAGLPDLEVQW